MQLNTVNKELETKSMEGLIENEITVKKLILGLLVIAVLCAATGTAIVFGTLRLHHSNTLFYQEQIMPLYDITIAIECSQALQVQVTDAVIYSTDMERLHSIESETKELMAKFEAQLSAYDAADMDAESRRSLDEAKQLYYSDYKPYLDELLAEAGTGSNQASLVTRLNEAKAVADKIVDRLAASRT